MGLTNAMCTVVNRTLSCTVQRITQAGSAALLAMAPKARRAGLHAD